MGANLFRLRDTTKRWASIGLMISLIAGSISLISYAQAPRSEGVFRVEAKNSRNEVKKDNTVYTATPSQATLSDIVSNRDKWSDLEIILKQSEDVSGQIKPDWFKVRLENLLIADSITWRPSLERGQKIAHDWRLEYQLKVSINPQRGELDEGDAVSWNLGRVEGLEQQDEIWELITLNGYDIGFATIEYTNDDEIILRTEFYKDIRQFSSLTITYTYDFGFIPVDQITEVEFELPGAGHVSYGLLMPKDGGESSAEETSSQEETTEESHTPGETTGGETSSAAETTTGGETSSAAETTTGGETSSAAEITTGGETSSAAETTTGGETTAETTTTTTTETTTAAETTGSHNGGGSGSGSGDSGPEGSRRPPTAAVPTSAAVSALETTAAVNGTTAEAMSSDAAGIRESVAWATESAEQAGALKGADAKSSADKNKSERSGQNPGTGESGTEPQREVSIAARVESKDSSQGQVLPGEVLTYRIRINNDSAKTIANIRIRDYLPEHTSFVAAGNGGVYGVADGSQRVTWEIAELLPGEAREVVLRVRVFACTPENYRIRNHYYWQADSDLSANAQADPEQSGSFEDIVVR